MGDPSDGIELESCEVAKEGSDLESVKQGLASEGKPKPNIEVLSQGTVEMEELKTEEPIAEKSDETDEIEEKKDIGNETIAKAMKKRTKYVKENSDQLTLAGLRRLLEEDMGLEMHSLDPFKKFIRDQVDEVLDPKKASKPSPSVKKIAPKSVKGKVTKKVRSEESSESAHSESHEDEGEDEEDEVKPRRKKEPKKVASEVKKRKKPTQDMKISGKKVKTEEKATDDGSGEENGNSSEDNRSHSSEEKPTAKKVASTPAYGKRVERLKSVIKSCGMSVPPVLYKKVNKVPENKRESQLIKELEEILSKEGLSSNPSEKEIKEVKKKKERAKELEGIDMSNIVSSTRRRSTSSYVAPPKPKLPAESDVESSEEEDEDEEDDDDDDENNDGSQSEESNVDDEVNSD